MYLQETDEIYFAETKEYFKEVTSSYAIGNYRSATVMLYSVAICDMLLKLKELKDMYNDSIATEILAKVDKARNQVDKKSKSSWEKEFIESIKRDTKLLDAVSYTALNHLYEDRNFSAHPALNENYELISPTKETTVANIKNILNGILIKPPIFLKSIIDTLTNDLETKKDIFIEAEDILEIYLNNKYYTKMPDSMKLATIKAFWKFSFCSPDDEQCMRNLDINRKALKILIHGFQKESIKYIKENRLLFTVSHNDRCIMNLTILLSSFPSLFKELTDDVQLQVEKIITSNDSAKLLAWFVYSTPENHLGFLNSVRNLTLESKAIKQMIQHYIDIGEQKILIDFLIEFYGKSNSYDRANSNFDNGILPILDRVNYMQAIRLIEVSNENNQIYDRSASYKDNTKIVSSVKEILGSDFDYSLYSNFEFASYVLQSKELSPEIEDPHDELPF